MADGKKSAGKPKNLLPMAWAVLVAALAGVLLWLSGTADETIEGLRASVDQAGLEISQELRERPPPPKPLMVTEVSEDDEAPAASPPEEAEPAEEMEEPPALPEAGGPPEPPSEPDDAADDAADAAGQTAPEEEAQLALVEPPAPDAAPELDADLPPWLANSRPFDQSDARPRIAIVVTDLGLSAAATQLAIQDLPGEVTLAFAAHASGLEVWIPQARAAGHEALVMVPMEPEGYPGDDPGPYTLLTALAPTTNIDRLDWSLRRASNFVGIIDTNGSRFTTVSGAVAPIVEELGNRGLMVVDSGSNEASVLPAVAREQAVPMALNDRSITDFASGNAIDLRLAELEAIARDRGFAVGVAFPYPIMFERLEAWIAELGAKGLTLAPITAVAEKPE